MPLPKRKKGEPHQQFIERCMSNRTMVKEFPDAAQRRAVCEDQARLLGTEALSLLSEPGTLVIEAAADGETATDGKPRLPRFSMVAYTGGPMRVAGWRYPVVVDLAGSAIAAAPQSEAAQTARRLIGPAETYGGQVAFRKVALLSIILAAIFGLLCINDRIRGGTLPG
ncbi:MAG: hypothetical protein KKE86_14180 [Planctomycetes bacterium]|nr:hypothetical protein [Planctomycetota bacterium]MCG2682903.1 hypothetical protein [Planctomycetales bacterium]